MEIAVIIPVPCEATRMTVCDNRLLLPIRGRPAVVPESQRQKRKGRYYFDDTFGLGRGSTFSFTIPIQLQERQEGEKAPGQIEISPEPE